MTYGEPAAGDFKPRKWAPAEDEGWRQGKKDDKAGQGHEGRHINVPGAAKG